MELSVGHGVSVGVGVGVDVDVAEGPCVGVGVSMGVPSDVGVSLPPAPPPLHWFEISVAVGYAVALYGSSTEKAAAYCSSAPQ